MGDLCREQKQLRQEEGIEKDGGRNDKYPDTLRTIHPSRWRSKVVISNYTCDLILISLMVKLKQH